MKPFLRMLGRLFLRLMDLLWVLGALAVCSAWWIGLVYKDARPDTVWFYLMPPLAVALFGFLWLFFTLNHRFRLAQLFVFVTVAACFVKVLVIDHRWNRQPEHLPKDNIRILHWNTAWGVLGVESIVRTMSLDNPDIIVISEPPRIDMISDIAYHALGMEHVFTSHGMTAASHHPITYLGELELDNLVAWKARIDTDRGSLELVAVDVVSRPEMNRLPVINKLADWIARRENTMPLVLIGDFNTPHDSVALDILRSNLLHAYESRGRGWPYTWPVPIPLYAIDHTWVSRDILVNDYHLKDAPFSDHKRQVVDLTLFRKVFAARGEPDR